MAGTRTNKRLKITIAAIVIFASAALYVRTTGFQAFGKDSNISQSSTVPVIRGSIEDVVTSQGKLEPKEYVDVGAQVSGRVEKLHVDLGDSVKTGDLIAELDAQIYETQVQGEEANLKTLNAQKSEQQAKVVQASQKTERNKKLYDTRALSEEAYQDSQTDLKVAQAQLNSVSAQIEQAESALEGNKTNLSYTKIYAPMSGDVVSQSAREGQTLNANQTTPTIVQIANLDIMTVKAQVAEADIVKIIPGMNVYFTILGSQERKWNGTVRQILPTPEIINDVVLYNVLVDVDNKDRQLMSGMSTQMFFILGKADNVLLVPMSALTKRLPGKSDTYEVEVQANGKTETRNVVIGIQDRTQAQVSSGLNEGDKVIMPAKPKDAAAGAKGMRGMARL